MLRNPWSSPSSMDTHLACSRGVIVARSGQLKSRPGPETRARQRGPSRRFRGRARLPTRRSEGLLPAASVYNRSRPAHTRSSPRRCSVTCPRPPIRGGKGVDTMGERCWSFSLPSIIDGVWVAARVATQRRRWRQCSSPRAAVLVGSSVLPPGMVFVRIVPMVSFATSKVKRLIRDRDAARHAALQTSRHAVLKTVSLGPVAGDHRVFGPRHQLGDDDGGSPRARRLYARRAAGGCGILSRGRSINGSDGRTRGPRWRRAKGWAERRACHSTEPWCRITRQSGVRAQALTTAAPVAPSRVQR